MLAGIRWIILLKSFRCLIAKTARVNVTENDGFVTENVLRILVLLGCFVPQHGKVYNST